MKSIPRRNTSPSRLPIGVNAATGKMMHVTKKMGADVSSQQGTTRILYDTISLATVRSQFNFFENVSVAINALGNVVGSNVDTTNGLLGVGEALALEYISFQHIVYAPLTGVVTTIQPVSSSAIAGLADGFYAGNFQLLIENNVVMKPISTIVMDPAYNPSPVGTATPNIFKFMTDLIIPELFKFKVELNIPPYTATADNYLRCTIQGRGSIYNAKTTF